MKKYVLVEVVATSSAKQENGITMVLLQILLLKIPPEGFGKHVPKQIGAAD